MTGRTGFSGWFTGYRITKEDQTKDGKEVLMRLQLAGWQVKVTCGCSAETGEQT